MQAIGRSRGGLSSKIHARVDALGKPVAFDLGAGQTEDREDADALLPRAVTGALFADHAYEARARIIGPMRRIGAQIVIPSRPARKVQRDYNWGLYRDQY